MNKYRGMSPSELRWVWLQKRPDARFNAFMAAAVCLAMLSGVVTTADTAVGCGFLAVLSLNAFLLASTARAASDLDELFKIGPRWSERAS